MNPERFSLSQEAFLNTLFTEMPCACIHHELVFDERGTAIDYVPLGANPGFERVIGVDPAHIIGRKASQYLPKNDAQHWLSVFAPAALYGKTVHYHLFSPQMNQTYYGTVISPERGFFLSMFTVVGNTAVPTVESDTDKKKIHERLSSADFTRKIFELMPCAGMISRIDLDSEGTPCDYTVVDVNFAFCELMDISREDIIGKRASERHTKKEFRHWLETFIPVAFNGKINREAVYLPRRKCVCDGVAICPERGFVMTVFTHLDTETRAHRSMTKSPHHDKIIDMDTVREGAFPSLENFTERLIDEMPCGAALHRIICDESGKAIDYVTTRVTQAFLT